MEGAGGGVEGESRKEDEDEDKSTKVQRSRQRRSQEEENVLRQQLSFPSVLSSTLTQKSEKTLFFVFLRLSKSNGQKEGEKIGRFKKKK